MWLGRIDQAATLYNHALNCLSQNSTFLTALGFACLKVNDHERGFEVFVRAALLETNRDSEVCTYHRNELID